MPLKITRSMLSLPRLLARSIFLVSFYLHFSSLVFSIFFLLSFVVFRSNLSLLRRFILMSLEYGDGFLYLALQGLVVLQHVQQLRVVDLEKHASDFAGQIGEHALDQREQTLAEHLLLFLRLSSCQHGRGQGLLSLDHHGLLRGRLRR